MTTSNHRIAAVAAGAAILVGFGSFGAVASGMITSDDIKNHEVKTADIDRGAVGSGKIEDGSLKIRDFDPATVSELQGAKTAADGAKGEKGEKGDTGPQGPAGPQGAPGHDGVVRYAGAEWSIVDRNVIGNGDAYLRSGPSSLGVDVPMGIGSLGLRTGGPDDKATFGNQTDFVGQLVKDISKIGFSVFNTGENMAGAGNNVPNIALEIDPNRGDVDSNYSTLVYVPNEDMSKANQWRTYDATAEGKWGLSGRAFTDTPCSINGGMCTWDELQAYLNDGGDDASILTVQITKGRDYAFSGAVDALVLNDTTYDFEPFGVYTR